MGKNDDVEKNVRALVKAISENNIEEIERLYNIDSRLVGGKILCIAVMSETFIKSETLTKLAELGANHENLDVKGNTCLINALLVKHPEYLENLLLDYQYVCEAGKKMSEESSLIAIKNLINIRNKEGKTLIDYFDNTEKDIEAKNMLIRNGYLEEKVVKTETISTKNALPKTSYVEKYEEKKSKKKSGGCLIL